MVMVLWQVKYYRVNYRISIFKLKSGLFLDQYRDDTGEEADRQSGADVSDGQYDFQHRIPMGVEAGKP